MSLPELLPSFAAIEAKGAQVTDGIGRVTIPVGDGVANLCAARRPRSLLRRSRIRSTSPNHSLSFDTVFKSEGVKIIHTPFRAPNADAMAERWVRPVRRELFGDVTSWVE